MLQVSGAGGHVQIWTDAGKHRRTRADMGGHVTRPFKVRAAMKILTQAAPVSLQYEDA